MYLYATLLVIYHVKLSKNLLLFIKKEGSVEHFHCKYQNISPLFVYWKEIKRVMHKKLQTSSGKNWNYI